MDRNMLITPNGSNPVIMLIVSGCTMAITKFIAIFANIYTWHVPPIVMECFQLVAWVGVSLTGLIAALNYFGVKIPHLFKRKRK